jgi:hypothetical protein
MNPPQRYVCPTLGDARAAFLRLVDGPLARPSVRLADALILRDWIECASQHLRCHYGARSSGAACELADSELARVVDDRPTSGRPEGGPR